MSYIAPSTGATRDGRRYNRHMVDIAPRITADQSVCHGKPVVKGTRVPVAVLVGHVGAGDPIDEVAADYGVTRDDVLAAIAYAAQVVAGEELRTT